MRVAIYARVSKPGKHQAPEDPRFRKDQDPSYQIEAVKKYIEYKGYTLAGVYVDHVTGDVVKRERARPRRRRQMDYDRLMMDATAQVEGVDALGNPTMVRAHFDILAVWKYDRLARSVLHLSQALQTFKDIGIEFVSVTEDIDTSTNHGKLFFHMLASFAEFERTVISERTKAGLRLVAARGKRLGRKKGLNVATNTLRKKIDPEILVNQFINENMTLQSMSELHNIPWATMRMLVGELVCRIRCFKHGKFRCYTCRNTRRAPVRKTPARAARNMAKYIGRILGPDGQPLN